MYNPLKRLFAKHTTAAQQFFYTPGPVFTEPAMAAIYNSNLSKPPQRILGGGYPIQMQLHVTSPPQLYAPKALTMAGIGIQQGQYAIAQLTDDDGTWTQSQDGTGIVQ
jgi:hypothetical protein